MTLARRFDPVQSSDETKRWDNPSQIPVDLAGAPVVLRLTPRGAVGGSALKGLRMRMARCGSPRGRASLAPRKRKARATCCAKSSRAHKGKRRRARRHHAHRRAQASWTPTCVSFGRRR